MKKRALIYGAAVGLAIGIIMFLIAGSSMTESSRFYPLFDFLNRPVLWLAPWLQQAFHGPGLYKLLVAFLCYWGLLGFLIGLGCRVLCNQDHREHQHHAA